MKQQVLKGMSGHGGVRKGAGRPLKKDRKGQPHLARPLIKRTTPIHINWHLNKKLKSINIRTKDFFKLFRLAVKTARKKGLHIIHYSLMDNHIHLIVEAPTNKLLSTALQSFALSLSKLVKNRMNGDIKRLWNDRYFMRLLLSPREVKIALEYVLKNPHKKFKTLTIFDGYSSILAMGKALRKKLFPSLNFKESENLRRRFETMSEEILRPPKSYLLMKALEIS